MWALSGGENAKFGLSTVDLLEAVDYLQAEGLIQSLKLIHFHIGSQIPDIQSIKQATREGARYYAKLKQMGCHGLEYLDVGGGLGVDYDGSRTNFISSTNYTLEEYAADIVFNVGDVCDEEGVPHPDIVSESGRAIVAHHSMLVLQVFGAISKSSNAAKLTDISPDDHKYIRQLADIRRRVTTNALESLHDAQQIKSDCQKAFELGFLDLRTKARVEAAYWDTCMAILEHYRQTPRDPREGLPEEIQELEAATASQYVCNFSVFQSLMDHWALDQLFPIMPLHRLNEAPDQQGTLVDITCDSDGKISKFTDLRATRDSLQVHSLRPGEPYFLGIFMTGAYQDIMGDLHNLFGRANEAHVFLDEDEEDGWYIEETIEGHSIGQVLSMTQYDPKDLARRMKQVVDEAIKSDRVKPAEGMRLLAEYEKAMQEPTYLNL
jgi:arginine decarboxylase